MSGDRKIGGGPNPRPVQPNDDGALHPSFAPDRSLVEDLGGVVDELRQVAVDLGMRPYRVFAIRVRWTGGAIGRGEAVLVEEREFLPTPEIRDTPIRGELRSGGLVERGTLRLRRLSPRYTEEQIRGMCGCGHAAPGEQRWIEARVDERDGCTRRRRFIVVGMPYRDAGGFQWQAELQRQDEDRSASGALPRLPDPR